MVRNVVTPPNWSDHRQLFENAFRKGDEPAMRLISVGSQIELARKDLQDVGPASVAEITDYYTGRTKEKLTSYITDQASALEKGRDGTLAMQRRVELLGCLADQLVLLPWLFQNQVRHAAKERRKLVADEGLYGSIGEIIGKSLEDIRVPAQNEREFSTGLITELTALALLNRDQDADFVALPTLANLDIAGKIDIKVHWLAPRYKTADLQVKTNELVRKRNFNPQDIVLVGGLAMGNGPQSTWWPEKGHFQTSQALVNELDGTASDLESYNLDKVSLGLVNAVKNHRQFTLRKQRSAAATKIPKQETKLENPVLINGAAGRT